MSERLIIFNDGTHQIFLTGTIIGAEIVFSELNLKNLPTGDEKFTFVVGEFSIPTAWLKPSPTTAGEWNFKPIQGGKTLTAALCFEGGAVGTVKFFGREFSLDAGIFAQLVIRIPNINTPQESFFALEVCGCIALEVGAVPFSTESLCFEVSIDVFKAVGDSLDLSLPVLNLGLPDFGFDLPKIRLPWNLNKVIPPFPLRLPSLSIAFPNFPIALSWKSINLTLGNDRLIIDFEMLRLSAEQGEIEGDLHLVFQSGEVIFGESKFKLHKPELPEIPLEGWHFDDNCLLVKWKQARVSEWLKLLLPDLADATDPIKEADLEKTDNQIDFALRLLRDGSGFSEARLDWKKTGSSRTLNFPGFKITFPPADFYTLIFGSGTIKKDNPDEEEEKPLIAFFSTLAAQSEIVAKSTFTFGRTEKRELLNDNENKSSELIEFTAKAKKAVSIAPAFLSLGEENKVPKFFHQLEDAPLTFLADIMANGNGERCLPTKIRLGSLTDEFWSGKLNFNLPATGFDFPFLKQEQNQFIKISRTPAPTEVDFGSKKIKAAFGVEIKVADLKAKSQFGLDFDWERFSFDVVGDKEINFTSDEPLLKTDFFGFKLTFKPGDDKKYFKLAIKDGNFQLFQADKSVITAAYTGATAPENPIEFALRDFKITSAGVSVKGTVTDSQVMLNGIGTKFQFTSGEFEISDNQLKGFSVCGSGPLPPDLVGDAKADIALCFTVENGRVVLDHGGAQLIGKNLLKCKSTRFEFSIDGIGLEMYKEGSNRHLYFTLTGTARFVLTGADKGSPLAWLPAIEMKFVNCPLAGDAKVLAKHIKFLVNLDQKPKFDFLGCFKMELRGIGFVPEFEPFGGDAAMQLSGQLMFADGAGDVIDSKIECHSLYIGLPEPRKFIPRIHFKDLSVKVKVGDAFSLEGAVEFLDDKEKGIEGFYGKGVLGIKSLPEITVAFAFVRIRRDADGANLRAWFLNINVGKLSYRTPLWGILIREIGLGFGYRYTLTSMSEALKLEDDPRALIAKLKVLSRSQGELSRLDQWSPDLEAPGQNPNWSVVARALFAQSSAASSITDWNQKAETELPCLFVMDLVLAMRSDLTFLMTGRGWLATNYNDYLTKDSLKTAPLFSGFAMLSPRRPRMLAHLSSNPGAEFGDHPPLPEFLKRAVKNSRFSATLLMEPGLIHHELGWANMLQWQETFGPLRADFRGGVIYRLSANEIVYGISFLARGSLDFSADTGGDIGARVSATANVAFGARFIGVLGLQSPLGETALYGGVGLEINVRASVRFWWRKEVFGHTITIIDRDFGFNLSFTASLEIGVTASNAIGGRGTATIGVSILGRSLHLRVGIGFNENAVRKAFEITNKYLNIGLEATETEPIPGTQETAELAFSPHPFAFISGENESLKNITSPSTNAFFKSLEEENELSWIKPLEEETLVDAEVLQITEFVAPHYSIFSIPVSERKEDGCYFLLFPNEETIAGENRQGFLPVPPQIISSDEVGNDFSWTIPFLSGCVLKQIIPKSDNDIPTIEERIIAENSVYEWKANWSKNISDDNAVIKLTLAQMMNLAFIPEKTDANSLETITDNADQFADIHPKDDPKLPWSGKLSPIEDHRVYNPSDNAFEAAVRGATEQFAGSPCFKRDPNLVYDQHLSSAFSEQTSIYSENGSKKPENNSGTPKPLTVEAITEQVIQLRSTILGQMVSDFQTYIEFLKAKQDVVNPQDVGDLVDKSIAFQMGLVFKTEKGIPDWIQQAFKARTIKQRVRTNENKLSAERDVKPFNVNQTNFKKNPPQFQRVQHYTDSNTVAITWDLIWSKNSIANLTTATKTPSEFEPFEISEEQKNPEHHLQYYHIRRRALSGKEREIEYKMKAGEALNVPTVTGKMIVSTEDGKGKLNYDGGGLDKIFRRKQEVKIFGCSDADNNHEKTIEEISSTEIIFTEPFNSNEPVEKLQIVSKVIQPLKSRFQFVDNFNEETAEDQAALPAAGKTYVYTITPVDVTRTPAPRPLTIIATRLPSEPPQVPADGELKVHYDLTNINYKPQIGRPSPLKPDKISIQWTEQPNSPNKPPVVIAERNLIFRREIAFPVGSYGVDADSAGNRPDGFPASNARRLRTDIVVQCKNFQITTEAKQKKFRAQIELDKNIFDAERWRAEAWQVFFQTKSDRGVESSLTHVQIVLEFVKEQNEKAADGQNKTVTRRPERLEWITAPFAFEILPPEDENADVGYANVPMPKFVEGDQLIGQWAGEAENELEYKEHPECLRSLRFEWNQGPSDKADYPADMQAGFRVFEYDTDAHLWQDPMPKETRFFDKLRRIQEVEVLSGENAALRPATTVVANQWEAWYPNTVRRINFQKAAQKNGAAQSSKAKLSPWNSWRDSYLVWADDRNMFARDGNALIACSAEGEMTVKATDTNTTITSKNGLFKDFREGQLVRVVSILDNKFNGEFTLKKVGDNSSKAFFDKGIFIGLEIDRPIKINLLVNGLFAGSTNETGAANLTIDSFIIKSRCEIKNQSLICTSGKLSVFRSGQYVRVSGANEPKNNGVKQISEVVSDNKLEFVSGSFAGDDICEKLDGGPFTNAHPWLAQIVSELENDDRFVVVLNPPPTAQPEELNALVAQATQRQDPYGWNILKQMGLSVAFVLRDQRTGRHLAFKEVKKAVADAVKKVVGANADLKKHLFVEYLFQPAKSVRLETEDKAAKQDDLLAMIQIALRPFVKQKYKYLLYESVEEPGKTFVSEIETGEDYTLIELSRNTIPIHCESSDKKRDVVASADGKITLLIRTASTIEKVKINGKVIDCQMPQIDPTDWRTTHFAPADWSDQKTLDKNEDFFVQWQRFRRYLLRYNPPNPASAEIPKLEAPQPTEKEKENFVKLLDWLNRFFEHGGDIKSGAPENQYGWCAAAYPRVLSPVGVTPDRIGRMSFYHLTEYKYACAKRYYIQPSGRYDALWQALAQSETLYPEDARRKKNLDALNQGTPAPNLDIGGLDVVLDRIHDLIAPAVLFSGRLDAKPAAGEIAAPGKTWEVAIAKHPEQTLVEKNQTLVRQLDYRQTAHTLLRRFAFADNLIAFYKAMGDDDIKDNLQFVESNEIALPTRYESEQGGSEHRLFKELTGRIGGFGENAFVLQWESLPYFYENRLLLVAQTSTVVSPVTEIIQREFEYQSPAPTAFAEGTNSDNQQDEKINNLSIKIPLNSYWDCTPEETKNCWRDEERISGEPKRKLSSLPDTDVIYDLVLEFSADLIETQVEIFFHQKLKDNEPTSGFYGREVGSKLKLVDATKAIKILPPMSPFNNSDDFVLEIELEGEKSLNVQPIESKNDFADSGVKTESPQPAAFVLLWDGAINAAEIERLRQFQKDKAARWDNSFANAFTQLIKQLDLKSGAQGDVRVSVEALIGLEQLREITKTNKVELPAAANAGRLIWRGGCDETELAALKIWGNRYEYPAICGELIKRLETTEIEFLTDGGTLPVVPDGLPNSLKERLTIETKTPPEKSKIVFKRLMFTQEQIDALKILRDDAALSQTFRDAVLALIEDLETNEVRIDASDYRRRPTAADLQAANLPVEKLLVANGLLGFRGWMTKDEAKRLLNSQAANPANQKSIRRLFNDSISRGFGNGKLNITARRGSAALKKSGINSDLS